MINIYTLFLQLLGVFGSDNSDFEQWSPKISTEDGCLFGHKVKFSTKFSVIILSLLHIFIAYADYIFPKET